MPRTYQRNRSNSMPRVSRRWLPALALAALVPAVAAQSSAWTHQFPNPTDHSTAFVHGLDAVDSMHAWAALDGNEVLRTVDGGTNWMHSSVPGISGFGQLDDVDFFDANRGWAVGTDNAFTGYTGQIARSVDGGATWAIQHTIPFAIMESIEVVDAMIVYAVGYIPGGSGYGFLMKTTNGGVTWTDVAGTGAAQEDTSFVDANTGWSVGGGVYRTLDGGATWESQFDVGGSCCYVEGVSFADAQNGWFVGWDDVYHTTDGGNTWTQQFPEGAPENQPIKDVHAINSTTAWIVGQDGYVARTTNGGTTWVQEMFVPGFQYAFEACYFLDMDTGWVGGANVPPQGGIWARDGSEGFVCQTDLGEKGHGMLFMSMCGDPLSPGGVSTLQVQGNPITANKTLFLIFSATNQPTYYEIIKWSLIPGAPHVIVPAVLDGDSSFTANVPGGGGPFTLYLQAVADSPLDYSGHATSNALQLDFLP